MLLGHGEVAQAARWRLVVGVGDAGGKLACRSGLGHGVEWGWVGVRGRESCAAVSGSERERQEEEEEREGGESAEALGGQIGQALELIAVPCRHRAS